MLKLIKLLLSLIIVCSIFISCNNKKIETLINQTSLVKIEFYGIKDQHITKVKEIEIKDTLEISNIAQFITSKNAPFYKAGYHGKIILLDKNGILLIEDGIEFNIYQECKHCVFMINNKIYSKKLSDKGLEYLINVYKTIPVDMQL